jgi:Phage endonuclease I
MGRAKWKQDHNGLTLRSGFEKRGAEFLDSRKVEYEYEAHKVKYTEPATNRTYTPDFRLPNGIFLEYKGRFTPADRRKMALVIEQNPELDIRLVFMRDNVLSKNSKTTYSAWCAKRGWTYHVSPDGSIPKEWLKENKKNNKKGQPNDE